jgi:hypothetical protein
MKRIITTTLLIGTLLFTSCKDAERVQTPKKEKQQVLKTKKVKNYDNILKMVTSLLLTNGKNLIFSTGRVIRNKPKSDFDIQRVFLCPIKTDELIPPSKVQITDINIDRKSINNKAIVKGRITMIGDMTRFREFEVILKYDGEIEKNKKISEYEVSYSEEQELVCLIEVL